MKIEIAMSLELNHVETIALKKLLGALSTNDKVKFGLSSKQCDLTTEMYNAINAVTNSEPA